MKKAYLLMGVAILLLLGSGCAKLPVELGGAGDAVAMAVEMANALSGLGKVFSPASINSVNSMSSAYAIDEADAEGWFADTYTHSETGNEFSLGFRFYISDSINPFAGTPLELLVARNNLTDMDMKMAGNSSEGSFDISLELRGVKTSTPTLSGTMTATITETSEEANITFSDLTINASGLLIGGTLTATYDIYTINMTFDSDGSADGTILEGSATIATLTVNADGTGTITHDGTTYDIATGETI